MPVLFIGHGSPMNAIAENDYTRCLNNIAKTLPTPNAILCISAHWMSEGTWITHMAHPRTIHDFFGFPKQLFDVQYPAPGAPKIAEEIQSLVKNYRINLDDEMWGLDHGTWSVLRHLYPQANIPVLQLSISMPQPPEYHFALGQALRPLRNKGILILGSGNIVHNLKLIRWEEDANPYSWAEEFDLWVKAKLEQRDFDALIQNATSTESGRLSIPTPDHWFPLLYVIGASDAQDTLRFEFEGIQNASISMRTFQFNFREK